tara:strand:- start:26 stop:805 length:780 start_codon:yes stop_codon:yes gene_type:complete
MDKVLVVTGGSRGIGAETARLAASRGYAVAVNYRERADAAQALVDEIQSAGGKAIAVQADVAKSADVERLFDTVDRELGRLTAFVNSAGHGGGYVRAKDFDPQVLDVIMQVTIVGAMVSAREAVRRMALSEGGQGGVIVNVSSMASTIGGRPGRTDYAAAKSAVDSFTVGLAKEVARDGIRVNAVRPAVTMTDMVDQLRHDDEARAAIADSIPINRIAEPIEVAQPIMWLLSDEASYVNGCLLDVSGGGFMVAELKKPK